MIGRFRITTEASYILQMFFEKRAYLPTELEPSARVDRAFRYDVQEDKKEAFAQNMELFHSYVRGGIEVMYEQFTDGCSTREDYMNKVFEILTTFRDEIAGITYEDELAKLIG